MTGKETDHPQASTIEPVPAFSLFDEISDVLEWTHNRAAPLAFVGLSIATLLWLDFLKLYAIPVSFFSSSLIAGLPALLATVMFLVMVLSINTVLPTFALCMPLFDEGPSLASAWLKSQRAESVDSDSMNGFDNTGADATKKPKKGEKNPGWILVRRWLLLSVTVGLILVVWVGVASTYLWSTLWTPLVVFGVSTLTAFIMFWSRFKEVAGQRPSLEFLFQFALSVTLQNTVAFSVLYPLIRTTPDTHLTTIFVRVVIYVLVLFTVGAVQLLVAKRVVLGAYPHMLRHVVVGSIALMAVMAFIPPLGGLLATYPLRVTAPNGTSCLVLNFLTLSQSQKTAYAAILDPQTSGSTKSLDFVTHFEDLYYAKREPIGGPVYAIPVSALGGFENGNCSVPARP